jgi:hypothetical protein
MGKYFFNFMSESSLDENMLNDLEENHKTEIPKLYQNEMIATYIYILLMNLCN